MINKGGVAKKYIERTLNNPLIIQTYLVDDHDIRIPLHIVKGLLEKCRQDEYLEALKNPDKKAGESKKIE